MNTERMKNTQFFGVQTVRYRRSRGLPTLLMKPYNNVTCYLLLSANTPQIVRRYTAPVFVREL